MVISGLGTAVPGHRYAQTECWETLQRARQFHELSARARAICFATSPLVSTIATLTFSVFLGRVQITPEHYVSFEPRPVAQRPDDKLGADEQSTIIHPGRKLKTLSLAILLFLLMTLSLVVTDATVRQVVQISTSIIRASAGQSVLFAEPTSAMT